MWLPMNPDPPVTRIVLIYLKDTSNRAPQPQYLRAVTSVGDREVQYETADVLFGRVEASAALVEIRPRPLTSYT